MFLLVFSGCKKPENVIENYDRATLLKSLADNVIKPAYNGLNNSIPALQTAANNFAATPNSANLQALQIAFDTTLAKWELCEVYDIEIADANIFNANVGTTPINASQIETFLATTSPMNQAAVAGTGSTRKGLAAIEYLIFGDENSILDSFANPQRALYLQALVNDIQVQTSAVYNDWNGGNSYSNFISQTQLDVSGSLNLLFNALTAHIETVRAAKIGFPAGLESTAHPASCEYVLSGNSLNNIRANNESWRQLFTGNGGVGINDYLDHVNAQYNNASLSSTLTDEFVTIKQKTDAISVPLDQAITAQSSAVADLHLELKKLTVLTKVDGASDLGVIITFSDNDGD